MTEKTVNISITTEINGNAVSDLMSIHIRI
jgi:hypothetical protein